MQNFNKKSYPHFITIKTRYPFFKEKKNDINRKKGIKKLFLPTLRVRDVATLHLFPYQNHVYFAPQNHQGIPPHRGILI